MSASVPSGDAAAQPDPLLDQIIECLRRNDEPLLRLSARVAQLEREKALVLGEARRKLVEAQGAD